MRQPPWTQRLTDVRTCCRARRARPPLRCGSAVHGRHRRGVHVARPGVVRPGATGRADPRGGARRRVRRSSRRSCSIRWSSSTPACAQRSGGGGEIRRLRHHAVLAARRQQLRLGSAGTHPFSLFERQRVMRRDRYRALIDELQYAGRRELIYGLHVHVGVDDPDRAIHVVNALRAHLCELVALSANSPFWRGAPTGYASCRHMVFSAFPRSGPPPEFASYAEYADGDRAARALPLPRGLHPHLVGRPAAPALRHRSRCAPWMR